MRIELQLTAMSIVINIRVDILPKLIFYLQKLLLKNGKDGRKVFFADKNIILSFHKNISLAINVFYYSFHLHNLYILIIFVSAFVSRILHFFYILFWEYSKSSC